MSVTKQCLEGKNWLLKTILHCDRQTKSLIYCSVVIEQRGMSKLV